jgi:hypothetical protein
VSPLYATVVGCLVNVVSQNAQTVHLTAAMVGGLALIWLMTSLQPRPDFSAMKL